MVLNSEYDITEHLAELKREIFSHSQVPVYGEPKSNNSSIHKLMRVKVEAVQKKNYKWVQEILNM